MVYKKKSLGQHFLRDEDAARRIAGALLPFSPAEFVLEIGPGEGALTRHLLALPEIDLRVCELDDRFVRELPGTFHALEGKILHRDFLTLAPDDLPNGSFALTGNFPYNISSQIIFRLLEWKARIPQLVGMFQREVAQRICAGPGGRDYGVLSVLAGAFYEAEYLFELPPEAFDPPPKVHSAVIRMRRRERAPLPDEALFRRLVKAAFLQRRKKLRNALSTWYPESVLALPFFDARAETLSVSTYETLAAAWPDFPESAIPHSMAAQAAGRKDTTPAKGKPTPDQLIDGAESDSGLPAKRRKKESPSNPKNHLP